MLPGFLTSGFLFGLLGALLPRWGYHISADYRTIGGYFICLALGVIVPTESAAGFFRRTSISHQMAAGCGLATASLILLAFIPLQASPVWRMFGLLLVGFSAGLINSALFAALSAAYTRDVARAVSIGGILFGVGCLSSALIVALTFYSLSVTGALLLLALVPGIFAFLYYRMNIPAIDTEGQPSLQDAVRDFRSFGTVAFALLLFFQFGNEWAIAGWLPMFLIEELGISPKTSILLLALYWTALLVGRVVLFALLRLRRTWASVVPECVGRGFRVYSAILHQQPVRRNYERSTDRIRICCHLSAGGREDRTAVHLLPSRPV